MPNEVADLAALERGFLASRHHLTAGENRRGVWDDFRNSLIGAAYPGRSWSGAANLESEGPRGEAESGVVRGDDE